MVVTTEDIVMNLVVNSGAGRSYAMEAIMAANDGKFEEAEEKLALGRQEINKAHIYQTELIQAEAGGESTEMSLIMVHGQDHLMTAMVVIDLAEQLIEMNKKIAALEK